MAASDLDRKLDYVARAPRRLEALLILAYWKIHYNWPLHYTDLVRYLGTATPRIVKLLKELYQEGLVTTTSHRSGLYTVTDMGLELAKYICDKYLGISIDTTNLDTILQKVREKHIFYKTRRGVRTASEAFSIAENTIDKRDRFISILNVIWRATEPIERVAASVYMTMDFDRASDELDEDLRSRAYRSLLNVVLRVTKLNAFSLPPNFAGTPVSVTDLVESLIKTWKWPRRLLKTRQEEVPTKLTEDIIDIAKIDKIITECEKLDLVRRSITGGSRWQLMPCLRTGIEAVNEIANRLDIVLKYTIDADQPLAVTIYLETLKLPTLDELFYPTDDFKILKAIREEISDARYREKIEHVYRKRLLGLKIVEEIRAGREVLVVPRSIFHRVIVHSYNSLDDIKKRIQSIIESSKKVRSIFLYVFRRISVTVQDLVRDLGLSSYDAKTILEDLARKGFVIPTLTRYLAVTVAPAREIVDLIHRDVYIYLYDKTRDYEQKLGSYAKVLIECLEELVRKGKIALDDYRIDRRTDYIISDYFNELSRYGIVRKDGPDVEIADEEMRRMLAMFITMYCVPQLLDLVDAKIVVPEIGRLREEIEEVRQKILEEFKNRTS